MNTPYVRAPHAEGPAKGATHPAPNAALLIDFDNVTMGMRSDLSKELKTLLNSDIIRGKVAVQRAYADWRRYPQYIVPLSEASIDLIFAPAYGSSKKNATDIRMAIDALELVFIRPEIGTFILLTGDSDFSSLVLKLKEYGKYVIGVGIQESSSDILVQNCDEYYSYTSLAGLRKTTDADTEPIDPWILVERSLERMEERNDVMRSDRLKQVMLELDAGFDEGEYGYSKFSRFLTEASSRGLVELKKLDNGQYEVRSSGKGASRRGSAPSSDGGGRGRQSRGGSRGRGESRKKTAASAQPTRESSSSRAEMTLDDTYELLEWAVRALVSERDAPAVRDSDVKRKMLDRNRGFDEAEVGFSKFSLFLQRADEDGVIRLRQRESGNYEVALPGAAPAPEHHSPVEKPSEGEPSTSSASGGAPADGPTGDSRARSSEESAQSGSTAGRRTLGPRRGERDVERRGRGATDGPPILEGQVVAKAGEVSAGADQPRSGSSAESESRSGPPPEDTPQSGGRGELGSSVTGPAVDPDDLGLPTEREAVVRYLTNSYRGVGERTAEALVDELGAGLFELLQRDPARVREILSPNRAAQLLEAWDDDLSRRRDRLGEEESGASDGGAEDTEAGGARSRAGDRSPGGHTSEDAPDSGSSRSEAGGPPAEEGAASGARESGGEASSGSAGQGAQAEREAGDGDAEAESDEPAPSRLGRRRTRRTRR